VFQSDVTGDRVERNCLLSGFDLAAPVAGRSCVRHKRGTASGALDLIYNYDEAGRITTLTLPMSKYKRAEPER
jgi:hypothetical protein